MPVDNLENPLDRITVTGTQFTPFDNFNPVFWGGTGSGGQSFNLPQLAFLSPGVPGSIEEIIAVGQRIAPTAARLGAGGSAPLATGMFWALGLLGVGYFIKKIVDTGIDQHFDEIYREQEAASEMSEARRIRRDLDAELFVNSPLGLPAEITEIFEPEPVISPQVLPLPTLPDPDYDPFFMPQTAPRFLPAQPRPDVRTSPLVVPSPFSIPVPSPLSIPQRRTIGIPAPLPMPTALPLPFASPRTLPLPLGLPQPFSFPDPKSAPRTAPFSSPFADPLTSIEPRSVDSPQDQLFEQPFAQPDFDTAKAECPPCTKDKKRKKDRTECWKKLVKEGRNEAQDKSFNWIKIDCDSGREL